MYFLPFGPICRAKRFFAHFSTVLTQSVLLKGKQEFPTQARSQAARLCQMNLFVVKSGEEPLNIACFSHVEWHFHTQSGEERQKIT